MDLNTVETLERPQGAEAVKARAGRLEDGEAWLAGGTGLFSEPQPGIRKLIDIAEAGWTPLTTDADGLEIAATCTIAELDEFEAPTAWRAAPLFSACANAFLASFKIWNVATVGGNLCMALPAGPMIALSAALDGTCRIYGRDGTVREVAALDFVKAPQRTALAPGELLRAIRLPVDRLRRPAAVRRISLSPMGRTGALVIGTLAPAGAVDITITGSTPRPIRLSFATPPTPAETVGAIDAAIPQSEWFDDIHGSPAWRRAMTQQFAVDIVAEVAKARP